MNEVQVCDILLWFGVFGAVDFPIYQRVPRGLEDSDFCSLRLTSYLTLENVVVPHVLLWNKDRTSHR